MIIEGVLNVVISLLTALFNLLPALPAMTEVINTYWAQFLTIFNNGLSLIMFFLYLKSCMLVWVSRLHYLSLTKLMM